MDWIISNDIDLPTSVGYSAILIDVSFTAKSHKPKVVKNSGEYIESIFIFLIKNIYQNINKLIYCWTITFWIALRMLLRAVEIMLYCPEHANPQNLEKFRKNSEHKAELFRLAAEMKALIPPNRKR